MMFKVPGLNPHGYHETRFEKDGSAFDLNGKYAGQADYPVRVMLDRAPERRYDAADFAGGPDIIYNGSFTKKAPYGDWPDGYYWSWCIRGRKWYRYEMESITLTRRVIKTGRSSQYISGSKAEENTRFRSKSVMTTGPIGFLPAESHFWMRTEKRSRAAAAGSAKNRNRMIGRNISRLTLLRQMLSPVNSTFWCLASKIRMCPSRI